MSVTIKRNWRAEASDGELGTVRHVIVDPRTHEMTHIVVGNDLGEWLLPYDEVDGVEDDRVALRGSLHDYANVDRFHRDDYRSVDAESDAVEVGSQAPEAPVAGGAVETVAADQPYHLQLREERLHVEKRAEPAGSVRLHRRIVERTVPIEVRVREERLVIENRSGAGRVFVGDRELGEGESTEITLMEERILINKQPVVVEDVVVRREWRERTERLSETLRREELEIDDPQGVVMSSDGREGYAVNDGNGTNTAGAPQPGVQAGGSSDPATGDVPAARAQIDEALHPRTARYEDPSRRDQPVPDVQPGNDPQNLRATYVPDSAKPVPAPEYNPGAGEYTEKLPAGPGGTEKATRPGSREGSNQQ